MSERCVYIIRHGHRADHGTLHERQSVLKSFDPPLTQIGMQQSFSLGENLEPNLTGKRLVLFSSPLWRCLQTVESLVNGLQVRFEKKMDKTVYVEDALRESQEPHIFKLGEYENIHFFEGKPLIYLKTQYNSHPLFADFRHQNDPFPEKEEHLHARGERILKALEGFLQDPKNADVIPILCTHGWMVEELFRIFENRFQAKYIYCSTAKLLLNAEGRLIPEFINKKIY